MNAPELTPDRIAEIKVLLVLAAVLSACVLFPHFFSWWLERRNRVLRSALQFYCPDCRRGTDWSEDRARCLECPSDSASGQPR